MPRTEFFKFPDVTKQYITIFVFTALDDVIKLHHSITAESGFSGG